MTINHNKHIIGSLLLCFAVKQMQIKASNKTLRCLVMALGKAIGNPVDSRPLAQLKHSIRASGTSEKRSSYKRSSNNVCKHIASFPLLNLSKFQSRWRLTSAQVNLSTDPNCSLKYNNAWEVHLCSSVQNRRAIG